MAGTPSDESGATLLTFKKASWQAAPIQAPRRAHLTAFQAVVAAALLLGTAGSRADILCVTNCHGSSVERFSGGAASGTTISTGLAGSAMGLAFTTNAGVPLSLIPPAAVPEASTWALLATGLVTIGLRRRRTGSVGER